MTQQGQTVAEGAATVTPYLVVRSAVKAIDFYKRAFGAEEVSSFPSPDGQSIMHASLRLGNSLIFLSDEFPDAGARSPQSLGGTTVSIHLSVADVDATFHKAVAAGAEAQLPPSDMFWGDRYCKITDPFGHEWQLATRKENLSPEELGKRAQTFFAQMQS